MSSRFALPLIGTILMLLWPSAASLADRPDLVLLIVVDQLTASAVREKRLGQDGIHYLRQHGTEFTNAQFAHSVTLTAAGHATLVTGAGPAQHGLVANEWFDLSRRRPVYSLGDDDSPIVGDAQRWAEGRSPRNLECTTLGDELVRASGGASRVFAVATKDRAAIALAGHRGKAYWYSKHSGRYVSSRYYHDAPPAWLESFNASGPADRYGGTKWDLLQDRADYRAAGEDDRPFERPAAGFGRVFPHALPAAGAALYRALPDTPMADELTLAVVGALVEAEQPGGRGATDLLAVSFSATDYIGHTFGPGSLEAEDNLLRVDRRISELLRLVDREIGLGRTLLVLASDHGVAPAPEALAAHGMDVGRVDPQALMADLDRHLRERFEVDEPLTLGYWLPYVYLDQEAIGRLGLGALAVERAAAERAARAPGIRYAFARSDLAGGKVPDQPEARRVQAAFHPDRTGHLVLVPRPNWYLGSERDDNAAMHGTPYVYDTHVPLLLAGPGVSARAVHRAVSMRDLAPTLSVYLGIPLPSGSVGEPLAEVLE